MRLPIAGLIICTYHHLANFLKSVGIVLCLFHCDFHIKVLWGFFVGLVFSCLFFFFPWTSSPFTAVTSCYWCHFQKFLVFVLCMYRYLYFKHISWKYNLYTAKPGQDLTLGRKKQTKNVENESIEIFDSCCKCFISFNLEIRMVQ